MRTRMKAWMLAGAMVMMSAQICAAAGFGIYEWSARSNALGGATVGRADDPSALASNPAGITQLDGLQIMGGFTAIHPVLDVKAGSSTYSSDSDSLWVPPHFYATYKVNDRYSIGIGTFSRFGLGSVFDDDWGGRYNSYEAIIKSESINPNVAVKVLDNLSVAVGIDATYLSFDKKQKLNLSGYGLSDGDLAIDADGWGYGFNIGLLYQPCKYSKIGLTYRSPVTMKVTGDADFSGTQAFTATGLLQDTSANGKVTLPDSISLGIAVYPIDKLSVEVGAVYTMWSKYDALTINYGDPTWPTATPTQTSQEKNWKDVWRFNIGVEYAVLDWLDLRAGYIYDQEPVRDETIDYMVPANDRQILCLGTGFRWDSWTLDLSYNYLMIKDRDIDGRTGSGVSDGSISNADAHMVGLTVGYKF